MTRFDFVSIVQLLPLFVFSIAVDIATDWIHLGPDARFSWTGAGGELFTIGVLLVVAAAQALMFRQRALVLAVPVLALAAYPISQVVHIAPYAYPAFETWAGPMAAAAYEIVMAAWSVAVLVRRRGRTRWQKRLLRGLLGGAMPGSLIAFASAAANGDVVAGTGRVARQPYEPASEPVLAAQQTLLDDALRVTMKILAD